MHWIDQPYRLSSDPIRAFLYFPIVENSSDAAMLLSGMDFERNLQGEPDSEIDPATLLLGPGRPHGLERLLRGQDPSREILCLSDLAELLPHEDSRAILDGTLVPAEDLGILRRALQAGRIEVTLLGGDPSTGSLRQLLKHPRARWLPYPPDSEELGQFAGRVHPAPAPPQKSQPASLPTAPIPEPPPTHVTPPEDPSLAEIETVLSQPVAALQVTETQEEERQTPLQPTPPERAPLTEPDTDTDTPESKLWEPEPGTETTPSPAPDPPAAPVTTEPPWFKDQVADLADLVQTVYASTSALQLEGESEGPPGLYGDALRLVQFTRTLGYLASPPARGETEIDLGELSEELLRSAGAVADAPRFLMRITDPLPVRANKELLVQAMDAVLVLARLCAGPEGEVRLSAQRTAEGVVELHLGFPSGPLQGLRPEEIVVPYALRSRMPDIGKNALRAAARIIEGQGGSLELVDVGVGQLRFSFSLPGA